MNVSVVDLSASQKKLQVEIPANKVRKELETRYRDLAKRARIKGFRPGKVPRTILESYYGKSVESEVASQFIQETFPEALHEADLKPLMQSDVEEMNFEDNGTFTYSTIVEVCPPMLLEDYRGLHVERPPVEVTEDRLQSELTRIRDQQAQLQALPEDHLIRSGDVALIDVVASIDGTVLEQFKKTDYMAEMGKQAVLPHFDEQLFGHHAGESLSFDVETPTEDMPPEMAGKSVHFEVEIKDVKERIIPELNDDFARELGNYETLEAFRDELRKQLLEQEEQRGTAEVHRQIIDQMVERAQFELSGKVIEKEVDHLVGLFQSQFERQGIPVDTATFNSPEIRAEYRPQAERGLRWRLIVEEIARREQLELSEEELQEVYSDVAGMLRMDLDKLRQEYAESSFVEQAKENKIQEKVFSLLEQEAVSGQTSDGQATAEQE